MALLFPAHYRAKGLFLGLAGLLGFCIASNNGLINFYRIILPNQTLPDGSYPYPANFWAINSAFADVSLCLVIIGVVAVFLAKEPDEYLYRIRLESIQFAVVVQFVVGLIAFAYFYITPGYQMADIYPSILGMNGCSFLMAYLMHYYFVKYFKSEYN
jgi:hypothetical protein